LGDAGWREEIARAIRISRHSLVRPGESQENYCWIEIGAGHGEMTEYLAATGASVYAVELDPPLVSKLQALAKQFPNLTVVPGDVMETDLLKLAGGRRIKLYGNLPYYITSPILHRFLTCPGHRRNTHRHSVGGSTSAGGAAPHARLWLPFGPDAVLLVSDDRPEAAAGRISAAAGGEFGPGFYALAGRECETQSRRRGLLSRFCKRLLRAKAQNAGE